MVLKGDHDEMHYKLCKKVAQLTKVIYQLNIQCEDNEIWTAQLRKKHEEEMRMVCSDAECRMKELQNAFAESERTSKAAVEAERQHCEAELSEARNAYAQKVELMTNDILTAKKKFEEVIAELETKKGKKLAEEVARVVAAKDAEKAKLAAVKDEEIANLRATKEGEVAELVREYNDRYKSMLAEQMDARDILEGRVHALQSQLDDAIATHGAEVEQWARKLNVAEAAAADTAAELAQLKESSSLLKTEKNRLQQEYDALRGRFDAELNSNGTLRDAETLLRREIEALGGQLKETQVERDRLERALSERTEALAKAFSNLTNMENQKSLLEMQQSRYQGDAAAAEQKNTQLMEQVAVLERCVAELRAETALSKEHIEQQRQKEQSLVERCEELRREMELLAKKHQDELAKLQASHKAALLVSNSALQNSQDALMKTLREEREQLENRHSEELRYLHEQHSQQLAQLAKEHEDVVCHIRHQLEDACGVETTLRATMAELQQRVAELEMKLTNARNELQTANTNEKNLITTHEAAINDLKRQLTEMEFYTDVMVFVEQETDKRKICELGEELERLCVQYKTELGVSKTIWENKLKKQAKEHEHVMQELRSRHSEHEAKIAELRTLHQKMTEQLTENAKQELDRERKNFLETQAELTNELRRRDEALRQYNDQMDAIRQSTKEQVTRLSEEVRGLKEHVVNLTGDVESLQEELKTKAAALRLSNDKHAALTKSLKAAEERERDLLRAYELLEQSANQSRLEVEALHKNYIATLERQHAQKLQTALDELRALLTAERMSAQKCADEALAAMRHRHAESQEEVRNLNLKLDALTCDLQKSLDEVRREQLKVSAVKKDLADTVEAMRSAFAAEKEEQQRLTERHFNEVAARHKFIVDDLMVQHNKKEAAQNALLKELQTALDELRHRYEYRESRAEDVMMINNLLKEGQQKDQALKKALNDLKCYRLELINREENYNKVFGRQPRVALGVSADKTQTQKY